MIEKLLRAPVRAAEAFGDDPRAALFAGERAVIARAPPRRRTEFTTARNCARVALGRLGCPPVPVLADRLGAPRWPDGVTGSITHCAGYRAAAVALTSDVASLGLDAAPNAPLRDPDMLEIIALDAERARLEELVTAAPGVCWDQLLFSAKEAVYKAWYPLARCWLDFGSADIEIDVRAGTFSARLAVPGPRAPAAPGGIVRGCWLASRELLLTAVVIPGSPDHYRTMNAPCMPI
jgi:4'-phosphopantetheinyl transferase EntD